MKIRFLIFSALLAAFATHSTIAASIVVGASNSTKESKARADFICDGKKDQIALLKSFTKAPRIKTVYERNPNTLVPTECYGSHSVEWLPGDYYLDETLVIPDAEDCSLRAEGARFHYLPSKGDAIVLTGLNRCRFYLGTIMTSS